jgi:apolipoprotein N-acyltransferase
MRQRKKIQKVSRARSLMVLPFLWCFVSAFLLILCFPPFNLTFLVWVSLPALFWALWLSKNRKQAMGLAYIHGLVFFAVTVSWIRHVTWFGYVAAVFYLAVYFSIFGYCVKPWLDEYKDKPSFKKSLALCWILPTFWTACELMRAIVPVMGMEWADLAHTQSHSVFLQLARLGSEFSVTFLIVAINVLLFLFILEKKWIKRLIWIVLGSILLFSAASYGKPFLRSETLEGPLRIGVLQGNVPQEEKWDMTFRLSIVSRYAKLSQEAALQNAQLLVWPEASFPDFFTRSYESSGLRSFVKELKIPMLIGTPYVDEKSHVSNSAVLVDADAKTLGRYDKIHLVPFGEYVPLGNFLFFLKPAAESLGVGDFVPGTERTVFELPVDLGGHVQNIRFATLICFEDMFSHLARQFVQNGAELLIVITNDAWFQKSGAAYQHLQGSIFRAVENGTWVVRAANTGISCVISPSGKVLDRVQDGAGRDIFVEGSRVWAIPYGRNPTLFQKGGWWFAYVCLFLLILDQVKRLFRQLTGRVQ